MKGHKAKWVGKITNKLQKHPLISRKCVLPSHPDLYLLETCYHHMEGDNLKSILGSTRKLKITANIISLRYQLCFIGLSKDLTPGFSTQLWYIRCVFCCHWDMRHYCLIHKNDWNSGQASLGFVLIKVCRQQCQLSFTFTLLLTL